MKKLILPAILCLAICADSSSPNDAKDYTWDDERQAPKCATTNCPYWYLVGIW